METKADEECPVLSNPHPDRSDAWESCCFKCDRQSTVYFGQLTFSFTVLGFCAIMLVDADGDCNKGSPYIGLISFLLGKIMSSVVDSTNHRQ